MLRWMACVGVVGENSILSLSVFSENRNGIEENGCGLRGLAKPVAKCAPPSYMSAVEMPSGFAFPAHCLS